MKTFRDYLQEAEKHISPSGVQTTMDPDDDDYEINYGKDGGVAKFRKSQGLDVKTGSKKISESGYEDEEADPETIDQVKGFLRGMLTGMAQDNEENPEDNTDAWRGDFEEVRDVYTNIESKGSATTWKELSDAITSYDTEFREVTMEWAEEELGKETFDRILQLGGYQDFDPGEDEPDFEVERESLDLSRIRELAGLGPLVSEDEDLSFSELKAELRTLYQKLKQDAEQGYDVTDDISDELGDFFDAVDSTENSYIKNGYALVRDTVDADPEEQAQAAAEAIRLLDIEGEDPDVEIESLVPEAEKKTKTQTKDKTADTDWSSLDDLFKPKPDQPLTKKEPEQNRDQPETEPDSDRRRRASQSATQRAAAGITPTDRMRDMLSRMRDIDQDPDDPGYPDPEPPEDLPDVRVNTQNLPAVAGQRLQAAGVQDPDFHKVANLPGNMNRAIRTLGRQLFRSLTRTPTDDVWMIGNLNGQGPNSRQEVNAVAGWVRDNGERVTDGNIDFDTTIPGYQADIQQWSAAGIRWLLVRDEFGDYIYSWPENDSITPSGNDRLAAPERSAPRRLGR